MRPKNASTNTSRGLNANKIFKLRAYEDFLLSKYFGTAYILQSFKSCRALPLHEAMTIKPSGKIVLHATSPIFPDHV
jgi:hypothetical protein